MHSLKTKFISLGLAAMMALGFAGCAMSTPATVGMIGGVEIPAGVYLLMQYNAYNTAASAADLATGETAQDVKAVLKATCTGTIGEEEVEATGEEYIARLTARSLDYYAAVEKRFAELGSVLDEAAAAEAAETADSLWSSNEALYTANGIGKSSLLTYLLNAQKAQAILELTYGEEGTAPVTEEEYREYISSECYYLETIQMPLMDYSTYSFATDEQKDQIGEVADACAADLNAAATVETASADMLYLAAMSYVPQAMAVMGSEVDASEAVYYASAQLYTPDTLASFESGDVNSLTDPLDEVPLGQWIKIDLGMYFIVARRVDPLESYAVADLVSQYDLLEELKSEQLQEELYTEGAALDHALNQSAVKTYAAGKIKKTV